MQITPCYRDGWDLLYNNNNFPTTSGYSSLANLFTTQYYGVFHFHNNKTTIGNTGHEIDRVTYNDPATIVFWKDGTKTVVKCQKGDTYNPETGLAMCIIKKVCGNKANYNNIFTKWLPKEGE